MRGEQMARRIDRVALLFQRIDAQRSRAAHDSIVPRDGGVELRSLREIRSHDARRFGQTLGRSAHERRHSVPARERRAHDGAPEEPAGTGDENAHGLHYTAPGFATPAPRAVWRSTKLLQYPASFQNAPGP